MELKGYQRQVIKDLKDYLDCVDETDDLQKSWQNYWQEKNLKPVQQYQEEIKHVPHICMKVPTGGGKTFLACASLKPIYRKLLRENPKMVVWLVPSESILTQTTAALSNPEHPYRRKIEEDFGGKVSVYSKEMLLQAQDFSVSSVLENLSICVMSYASLRIDSRKQDVRKVFQENSALKLFAEYFHNPDFLLAETPESALINILREISPLVVVDESHNAKSDLSIEMLKNLNPSFILELTATPKTTSNIISYVNARDLKMENMVKLPVVIFKKDTRQKVITDAISMRNQIEFQAVENEKRGGKYIRPIILFQAQPKGKADNATFEEIKKILVKMGIPPKEIAIKTSNVNELDGVNLMSKRCPIRYIITVNALKEGWDCPFAYILASLASRSSATDVEQIVGRILRQPYAENLSTPLLNIAYVFSCNKNFQDTVDKIVDGMKLAGFTKDECRTAPVEETETESETVAQEDLILENETATDENFSDINVEAAQKEISANVTNDDVQKATEQAKTYENIFAEMPKVEVKDNIPQFKMRETFRESVDGLKIPQFFREITASLFGNEYVFLEREHLSEKFNLDKQNADVSFALSPNDMVKVDIEDSGDALPKYKIISGKERERLVNYFESLPSKNKINQCTNTIAKIVSDNTGLQFNNVKNYVKRIIGDMDDGELAAISRQYPFYAARIQQKITALLNDYRKENFRRWLDTGEIICQKSYALPQIINLQKSIDSIPKSLYTAEGTMNNFERRMINELVNFQNVKWWHRIIERKDFRLNGFINHYPDFLVMLESGKIILVETKGDYLTNDDSREKLALGRKWQSRAGSNYNYFMVFDNNKIDADGAYNFNEFLNVVSDL